MSRRWRNSSEWSLLSLRLRSCPEGATFASLLSGVKLLEPALCLHRQLLRVQSVCPLRIFYDQLPTPAVHRLESEVGKDQATAASWLLHNANMTLAVHAIMGAKVESNASAAPDVVGRRLLSKSSSMSFAFSSAGMLGKLALFALLQFSRIVFIDIDVLVLHNIDALFALPPGKLGAVHVGGSCTRTVPWEPFNSGVLVITPDASTFNRMMLRLCMWYAQPLHNKTDVYERLFGSSCAMYSQGRAVSAVPGHQKRLIKVCERRILDQSVLNFHFRSDYIRLPYSYNAVPTTWRQIPPISGGLTSLAIIHYVGEPKPWVYSPTWDGHTHSSKVKLQPWKREARKLWNATCSR